MNTPPPLQTERPLPSINPATSHNRLLYGVLAATLLLLGGFAWLHHRRPQPGDGGEVTVSLEPPPRAGVKSRVETRLDAGVTPLELPPPAPPASAAANPIVPPIPLQPVSMAPPVSSLEGTAAGGKAGPPTPTQRRRHSKLVAYDGTGNGGNAAASSSTGFAPTGGVPAPALPVAAGGLANALAALTNGGSSGAGSASGGTGNNLATRLVPTKTVEVQAAVLRNRDFLMTKGAFLDCILETRINTSVPGMVSCRLDRDEYGSTGRIVLLDRGTRLTGEYQGSVKRGENRIFVLWTRAETPEGVVIDLDSPGSDALGEAGLGGFIDSHFLERFGSALLLSVVQDAVAAAASAAGSNTGGTTIKTSQDAASIAVENSINIAPTLIKNQGERVNILVARDLDFSTAYTLATATPTVGVAAPSHSGAAPP